MQGKLTLKHRLIALLLTIIFIGYVGNNTFFMHTHTENNRVIVHAHPYGESTHTHSSASFHTISLLNHFLATATAVLTVAMACMYLISIFRNQIIVRIKEKTQNNISLRAPPAQIA